jgi:acyl-CoA dehydrogenase
MTTASQNILTVKPIASLSDEVNMVRLATAKIVAEYVIPQEKILGGLEGEEARDSLYEELRNHVRREGLWKPHLPEEYGGMGAGFLTLAYMNEIMAWSPFSKTCFGMVAPSAGNESVLAKYATPQQIEKWLIPSINGEMQSCFSMTEPDNPGSDPRSLQTTARLEGDEWVINGRKWFTSNARRADFAIVMCRTEIEDDSGNVNSKMTQIIVPTDSEGFEIVRDIPVWGHTSGSHGEITYTNVRVPKENALGRRGTGHAAAQDRLGAGRVYHCMNCVGSMWRAFDLMVKRATEREVHGGKLEDKQFIQGFIADSYMDIQASRLMTIHTAEVIESGRDPRTDISAIKVFVPAAMHRVVDRAIQTFGGIGISSDYPLAGFYLGARTLRIADGPDEVHKILIAKNILKQYHNGFSWDFG